jgi:hypothetical protein
MTSKPQRAVSDFVRKAGATIEFKPTGGGHIKATIWLAGRSRYFIMASSPRSDNQQADKAHARRTLRELSSTGAMQ